MVSAGPSLPWGRIAAVLRHFHFHFRGRPMSILRIAVDEHLRHNRMTVRELFEAAYYRRYGKPIPQMALNDDLRSWEAGKSDIEYLRDFIIYPNGRR